MIFISLINILNISIILMTIIVFFNYSSAEIPKQTFFQLAKRNDTNYFVYSAREPRPGEKKMTIHEFYLSKHNLEARRIPLPTDTSVEDQKKRIKLYCTKIPKLPYNMFIEDFDVYYQPTTATNNHCLEAFQKLSSTLFTCMGSWHNFINKKKEEEIKPEPCKSGINDEENEEIALLKTKFNNQLEERKADMASIMNYLQRVPSALTNLKYALQNEDEPNAAKFKCCDMTTFQFWSRFQNKDDVFAKNVITRIEKIYKNKLDKDTENETKFYICMMAFKNGVTELNKAIGKYTPERMSKQDLNTLDPKYKKVYNRKIIELDDYDNLSPQKKETYKMSQANKKKILGIDEIMFLQDVVDQSYSLNVIKKWQKIFTGDYQAPEDVKVHKNDNENDCINGIEIMDQLNFKVTKLSYMVYPNKQEKSLISYREKKKIIIKHLKLLDENVGKNPKNNESGKKEEANNNHIYKSYEDENNKMCVFNFIQLKLCRAIKGEAYDTYVLRLNNNECVPLHKEAWKSEIIDMKRIKSIDIIHSSEYSEIKLD